MMFTLLPSTAIAALALLMLWHAYARACRDYIEQRQSSVGIVVPIGTSRA
jgi:hypothetical protein